MNTVQVIVDALENAGLFLEDHKVSRDGKHDLYFSTSSGLSPLDVDLDEVYDLASEYAAVTVYDAFHLGQDVIVVSVEL